MESMDNVRERFEALEQRTEHLKPQTRMGERQLRWWHIPWRVAAMIALGLVLTYPHLVRAKTFHCGAGDVQCLIDAINEANANGEKNTIRLEAGTYTLTEVDNDTEGPNGLPSLIGTLTLRGADPDTTIIERAASAPPFRLLQIAASGTLTLERLTVQGGLCISSPPPERNCPLQSGGGLLNRGTLTLQRHFENICS
jgi:hypothetical protein